MLNQKVVSQLRGNGGSKSLNSFKAGGPKALNHKPEAKPASLKPKASLGVSRPGTMRMMKPKSLSY